MSEIKTCDLCEHLNFTEQEQNKLKIKISHFCNKYKKQVYHMSMHPLIIATDECQQTEVNNVEL